MCAVGTNAHLVDRLNCFRLPLPGLHTTSCTLTPSLFDHLLGLVHSLTSSVPAIPLFFCLSRSCAFLKTQFWLYPHWVFFPSLVLYNARSEWSLVRPGAIGYLIVLALAACVSFVCPRLALESPLCPHGTALHRAKSLISPQ